MPIFCRLQDLVQEVGSLPQDHPALSHQSLESRLAMPELGNEGYQAPLLARAHLRLGIWRWTVTPSEVSNADI